MTKFILLGAMILIAIIFIIIKSRANNIIYKGQNKLLEKNSMELFTSDVIDDDFDDPYRENDWSDVAYNENDYAEDDFNYNIELFDDLLN